MVKEKIHENCKGCTRIDENDECIAYSKPSIWWRYGRTCTLSGKYLLTGENNKQGKQRVGQQKQKKKA